MTKAYSSTSKFYIIFSLVIILLSWVSWDGVLLLVDRWYTDEAYGHGFLLPFIIAFFIIRDRPQIAQSEFTESWIAAVLFIGTLLISLLAHATQILTLVYQTYLISLCFLIWAIMGRSCLRVLLPVSLIFFAVPLPFFTQATLTADLQLLSTQFGAAILRFFEVTIHIEGNIIDFGEYQLQVIEACAGLNYLLPLLGLGHICAYLFQTSMWKRLFLVFSTIPISIAMNSIRIAMTGLLMSKYGLNIAEGFFHSFQGWVIFLLSTGILMVELVILNKIGSHSINLADMFDLSASKGNRSKDEETIPRAFPRTLYFALIGVVITGALVYSQEVREEFIPTRPPFAIFPMQIEAWEGVELHASLDALQKLGTDDHLMASYRNRTEPSTVELFIAYFDSQKSNDKNPHSPKACLPGGGWEIQSLEQVEKSTHSGKIISLNKMVIQKGHQKQILYYWFNLHGRSIANEYRMKAYLLEDSLTLNRTDGALIRLNTIVHESETVEQAEDRLNLFLGSVSQHVDRFIPSIEDSSVN